MVMVVGCKCGKSRIVSQEPDPEYGQYYCVINCEECGYYWEGYMGHYEGKLYGYNKVYEVVALHANDVLPLFADVRNRFPDGPHASRIIERLQQVSDFYRSHGSEDSGISFECDEAIKAIRNNL